MNTSMGVGDLLRLDIKCPPTWWRNKPALVTEIYQTGLDKSFVVKMAVSTDTGLRTVILPLAYVRGCKVDKNESIKS